MDKTLWHCANLKIQDIMDDIVFDSVSVQGPKSKSVKEESTCLWMGAGHKRKGTWCGSG